MCLDELRRHRPTLGFALYALTPGDKVTLEVHDAGRVYTFEGPNAQAAITVAFPELAKEKFDTPIERDDGADKLQIPHMLRRPPPLEDRDGSKPTGLFDDAPAAPPPPPSIFD